MNDIELKLDEDSSTVPIATPESLEAESIANEERMEAELNPSLKANPLPAEPTWLRANTAAATVGVDREQRAILGYVVAQEGVFLEPDPRGEFDETSLRQIVKLMKAKPGGTKVRFGHPGLSSDALGSFLGRAKNPRLDSVTVQRNGEAVTLKAVRADLYFSASAGEGNPNGNLADYVMNLAEEDSDSLGSSLVLEPLEELRRDNHGKPKMDDNGKALPPLWRVNRIHASDLVDQGATVDGLLSAGIEVDGLPDAVVRQATELLDRQFGDCSRDVIEARLGAFAQRYLNWKFGEKEEAEATEPKATAPSESDEDLRLRWQNKKRKAKAA